MNDCRQAQLVRVATRRIERINVILVAAAHSTRVLIEGMEVRRIAPDAETAAVVAPRG